MKIKLFALLALAPFSAILAHATPISGSEAISIIGVQVTNSGAPLDPIGGVGLIDFLGVITSGTGHGDLSGLSSFVLATGSTSLNPDAPSGFTLTFGTFGTFTESSISLIAESTTGTSSNAALYLLGTFTPGASLSTFTPGPASLDLGFTETAGSLSGSGTLASPPALTATPEPSSLVLLGSGLASAAGLVFRRRNA